MINNEIDEKILELGGMSMVEDAIREEVKLNEINGFVLPNDYIYFLNHYGFSFFNDLVYCHSKTRFRLCETYGYCDLGFFYGHGIYRGTGKGIYLLKEINKDTMDYLEYDLFIFADGFPGDYLCFGRDSKIYYWWHESYEGEEVYLIADDFESFIKGMKPYTSLKA